MPDSASFASLVTTSESVAATSSRNAKKTAIASYLLTVPVDELPIAVSFLIGRPRQNRLGAGWSAAYTIDATPATEPSLTLLDVDEAFATMSAMSGPGSQTARLELLEEIMRQSTADEQSFLKRLIVRDLRQGATEGVMIDAVATAASVSRTAVRRANMLTGDLVATAELALSGGRDALESVGLELFRPMAPMLAATAASVAEAMDGEALVETKFDGARIQLHRSGNRVRVYTRNLNDITHRLPGIVAESLEFPFDSLVADGEVLAVAEDGSPVLFQDTMQQFSADGVPEHGPGSEVRAFYFDLLHADGDDLIDRPLSDRRRVLEGLPENVVAPQVATSDPAEGQRFMDEVVSVGHEGVIVKDPASTYDAGRRGSSWKKVKPVHTFDLVVIGVEWGSGRRQGWLSNIHLGARTDEGFAMVGKTFKGMTDAMLEWQTERFLELETHRDRRTVFVRPEQVVEIAIDGVQRSPTYAAGVALRFARVKRYRDDKTAGEADTLDMLKALGRG